MQILPVSEKYSATREVIMLEAIGTSYTDYIILNFLSENKPRRVQADLSEEKPLNAAHPPSNIGNFTSDLSPVTCTCYSVGNHCDCVPLKLILHVVV